MKEKRRMQKIPKETKNKKIDSKDILWSDGIEPTTFLV